MTSASEKWLTLSQAAEYLGVHATTLRRWADNGDIPVRLTPGGHRRFLMAELRAHVKDNSPQAEHTIEDQASQPAHDHRHPHAVPAPLQQTVLPPENTGRVWADFALVETRQRLVSQPEPAWLMAFGKEDRHEKRELGRRLMALLMQHISAPDDNHNLLIEARSIATRYAQNCVMVGLSAAESLEATTFFRDAMTEVALQMPQVAQLNNQAQLRLLRKLNQIFNVVQVSLIEYYDSQADSDHDRK